MSSGGAHVIRGFETEGLGIGGPSVNNSYTCLGDINDPQNYETIQNTSTFNT